MFELRNYSVARVMREESRFFVPKYQRSSSWDKTYYTQFANDILDDEDIASGEEYFIGTFILKPQEERDELYEIIDGQQRLIALSLFVVALYEILINLIKTYKTREDVGIEILSELNGFAKEMKNFLIMKTGNKNAGEIRFKASEYEGDNDNFRYLLQKCQIIETDKDIVNKFTRSDMTSAFNFYRKCLKDNKNLDFNRFSIKEAMDGINKVLQRLEKIKFIVIEVKNHVDACQLFDSFNNRGKQLEAIDIVKNTLFSNMQESKGNSDIFFEQWNGLSLNLKTALERNKGGASNHSDRYLRHFYNAFYREEPKFRLTEKAVSSSKSSFISKKNLTVFYERIITEKGGMAAGLLVSKLYDKSKIYNMIIDPDSHKNLETIRIKENAVKCNILDSLIALDNIKGAPANVLLLYLFSKFSIKPKNFDNGEKTLESAVDFLVKFFVRRNISQFPRTNIMDSLMDQAIKNCEDCITKNHDKISSLELEKFIISESEIKEKEKFITDLTEFTVDDYFSNKLMRILFQSTNNFYHKSSGREHDYKEIADNAELEHILPQNLSREWLEEIANGDKEKAKRIQDEWLHRLGNLTLTYVNPKLSNKDFIYKQNKIADGYSKTDFWLDNFTFSVAEMNESYSLATAPSWDENFINGRNKILAKHIADFYKFKSES